MTLVHTSPEYQKAHLALIWAFQSAMAGKELDQVLTLSAFLNFYRGWKAAMREVRKAIK